MKIVKNVVISIIIGTLLGFISEYALILNISWLIKITQSLWFWGFIMCITAFLSKNYMFSLINSIIIMLSMNNTYYIIRLIKSGYTNIGSWRMYTLTSIAGSLYLGTITYLIKEKIIYHKTTNIIQKYNFIFMTIIGIVFFIYAFFNIISNNLFYNIDIGIISGFVIGTIIAKCFNKRKHNTAIKK